MSSLFSTPKISAPPIMTPLPKEISQKQVQAGQDDMRKRLMSMMGRSQTVLTGPFGAMNRKTVLGA
jgi:hypothetical protein